MEARDDRQHPTLRRARPLGQLRIDALEKGAGRTAYGSRQVQEIEAKSALTEAAMGFPCWSLNPYVGCLHDCGYCYVPDTMRTDRTRWGSFVAVKTNLPTLLRRELASKEPRRVYLSTATDCYQPVEREHKVTRACLELLLRADWPVRVLTRSPLVLRDMDLLRRFSDLEVGLSVPTLDDRVRAILEPGAPPIQARLDTLRALADAGLTTFANHAPAYPLTGGITPTQVAEALAATGIQSAYTAPWGYLEGVLPVLDARMAAHAGPGSGLEEFAARVHDPQSQDRLQAALKVAFERAGIPLSQGSFRHQPASRTRPAPTPARPSGRDGPAPAAPAPRPAA
ncbi:MAG: hypothetical protein QOD77_209 [Thermoplasmata archaeon]|jgi:DNA repair photolyase|nr:hypothetical protein [Thermoplasmata archaeon]